MASAGRGRRCDIGAYEFALPTVSSSPPPPTAPTPAARVSWSTTAAPKVAWPARSRAATEACRRASGSVPRVDRGRLVVTDFDRSGHRTRNVVRYDADLRQPHAEGDRDSARPHRHGRRLRRLGPVACHRGGPGDCRQHRGSGSSSPCHGITCWIGGGALIYRLLDGPFAGNSSTSLRTSESRSTSARSSGRASVWPSSARPHRIWKPDGPQGAGRRHWPSPITTSAYAGTRVGGPRLRDGTSTRSWSDWARHRATYSPIHPTSACRAAGRPGADSASACRAAGRPGTDSAGGLRGCLSVLKVLHDLVRGTTVRRGRRGTCLRGQRRRGGGQRCSWPPPPAPGADPARPQPSSGPQTC